MRFSRVIAIASLLVGAVIAQDNEAPADETPIIRGSLERAIPGTFLVELDASITDKKAYITEKLQAAGVDPTDIEWRVDISTDLFNGASFTIPSDEATDEIVSTIGSLNTFRVGAKAIPAPIDMSAEPEAAPEFEPSAINITNFASERIHAWTGVNEARTKLGLTGKGIRVAVIDSGVDYMNPALGGGFGPGFKVAYGYDLVGDAYSFTNPVIKPDNDPMDNCSSGSHGTHVAGIVGAFAYGLTGINNPTAGPFSGAAPEATIGAYRVFGCAADFTSEDFVAQAIFLAAKDNSHIINLSLGGGPVFADGADSYAAEVVGKAGHYVVASNGNSQSAGLMTNGSPAISRGGLGIASFDNTASPQAFMSIEGRRFPSTFGTANSAFKLNEPLEVVAFNVDADDLNILNDGLVLPATGTLNVAGKAIMFRGGNGTVAQRCTNAVTMGAAACIVYSNTIVTSTNPGVAAIPSLTTSNAAGRLILDVIKAGRPAFVRMSLLSSVSSFSSPGLDPELYIKPDVGGMGGSIYSTLSRFAAGAGRSPYGTKSGTSMSSPYTAGALALLLEAKGAANLNFETVRTLIMNTATPANIIRSPLVDSVTRQGAGLINIYNAITTKTIVSPPALNLNDTKLLKQHYILTINNTDTVPIVYNFTHIPAVMATPFQPNDDALQTIANTTFTADYAIVKFSRLNDLVDSLVFTLAPGASRRVFVHFDAPPNAIAGRFPVYSGYIAVAIAGGANHRVVATVPYAGMVGSWKDAPIWSRNSWVYTNRYLRPTWGTAANITASTGLYAARTFAPLRTAQPWSIVNATRGAFLLPIASTTSRYAMIEVLFAGNETQKAALPRALRHKSPLGYLIASRITTPTPLTVDPKAPAVFSQLSRNTPTASQGVEAPSAWLWNGEITTNSTTADRVIKLPAGRYQVRFSALKHFARLGAQSGGRNYDEVLSPVFELTF